LRIFSLSRAPNRVDKTAASTLLKDYEAKGPISTLRMYLKQFLNPFYAQDALAEIMANPVDVCIVDNLLMGALFAPEKAGIPAVLLAPYRDSSIPPPGVGVRGKASLFLKEFMFQHVLFREAFGDLQNSRRGLGLAPIGSFFSYLHNLPLILMMTSRAFDFKAKPGPNVRYISPMLDDPTWVEDWQSPWSANHPDPLVVIAPSTTYQKQEELFQKVIDAMAGLPVRGLVALGPALEHAQFNIPSNVTVRRSIPYSQVFPLASAVITQCGHGTVMRALAIGVPILGIPFGRDEDGNARRIEALGAGLQLDKQTTVETIRKAVQRILDEAMFRDNARKLGRALSEEAKNSTGIQELEHLASISKSTRTNA